MRTFAFLSLFALVTPALADEVLDAKAAMRDAAIEQAEIAPPPQVSTTGQARSSDGQGKTERTLGAVMSDVHRAAVEAAQAAAHVPLSATIAGRVGPSTSAAARGTSADATQRSAAAAAQAQTVRSSRAGGPGNHPGRP